MTTASQKQVTQLIITFLLIHKIWWLNKNNNKIIQENKEMSCVLVVSKF